MKTLLTAEAIFGGERSRSPQTPDLRRIGTLGTLLETGASHQANGPADRIKIGLGIALLAALTGCVGYVDGGYYGGPVAVPGPDVYFWGGDYDRGRDMHAYSKRGAASREVAHPARSAPAHASSGGHGGKR